MEYFLKKYIELVFESKSFLDIYKSVDVEQKKKAKETAGQEQQSQEKPEPENNNQEYINQDQVGFDRLLKKSSRTR